MRKVVDDPRLMIKVCDLYYNHEAGKQQIGEQLGLSRPTVSRLLSAAREQGIVQISIPDVDTITYWELEQKLERRYGLKKVLVVEPGDTEEELETALGKASARYFQDIVEDGCTVGVSMGSTLYHMISNLEVTERKQVTFLPLIGGMGRLRTELHSNSLAERLSQLYGGTFLALHAPARVSSIQIRNELMKEESIAAVTELMAQMDIALVGIGFPNENSSIKATGYFKENEVESLLQRGAAGELCMQFYDTDGNTSPYRNDNAVVGVDIRKLRKIPCSIGIAGGMEKLTAIQGAIRGKYINMLITDARCASALVADESESL